MSRTPPPISVRGGAGGIVADCAQIAATARPFRAVAEETLSAALALHAYLARPAVLGSALLDPTGFAAFEADLLGALDGPHGLAWTSAAAGAVDLELRSAAAAYRSADALGNDLHDAVAGALRLPVAVGAGTAALAITGDPSTAAQAAITRDPELADTVVDLLALPTAISVAARVLPDGRGVARDTGPDSGGAAGRPPRTVQDLLRDLARRNVDDRHGEIDVRILTLADGSRRVVVDITGTKSWSPRSTPDITSLTTNGRALIGDRTAYEQGVLLAMRRAGVRRGDQVLLVGHSEGGMVAVTTARDAARSGEFDVTHVLTVGSPVGLTVGEVPASVQVLALENRTDVVPHLDGRQNPDRRNVTTVTGSAGDHTVVGDHDIEGAYVPIAGAAQASDDRSVRAYLRSVDPYLSATSVRTRTYQILRR